MTFDTFSAIVVTVGMFGFVLALCWLLRAP